jgi:hypothetical protein
MTKKNYVQKNKSIKVSSAQIYNKFKINKKKKKT